MLRRSMLVVAVVSTAAGLLTPTPALAITGGSPNTVRTNVGVVRFTIPDGRFRCSGTLISPTVVLTAGHCTADATNVYVSFDDTLPADRSRRGSARRRERLAPRATSPAPPTPIPAGRAR